MASDLNVTVKHLTRVEGHGNIYFNAKAGKVEKVLWEVDEAPRFFEAMVRGKSYSYLSHITSRICGICSIGHSLASLKATEAAMGVKITEQTELLRRLALHGENLQSHSLHVGYLAAPDLFGAPSVVPMVKTHLDAVGKIVAVHRLANRLSDVTCGRTTHPITLTVGGFTKVPSEEDLLFAKKECEKNIEVTRSLAKDILTVKDKVPDFVRETEFIALVNRKHYAFYDGFIGSTDGGTYPVKDYLKVTNEYFAPQSTAKYARHKRASYMASALSRFNLNYKQLTDGAKEVAEMFGLEPVCHNPYMNTIAQLVEIMHSLEDSIDLVDKVIAMGLEEEEIEVEVRPGRGVGAVEVPRGILFHDYTIDEVGNCVKANCIIPTNQNHGNIQQDMEAMAPKLVNMPEKDIELRLEMLVRAYDPCISCSTHYVKVNFV